MLPTDHRTVGLGNPLGNSLGHPRERRVRDAARGHQLLEVGQGRRGVEPGLLDESATEGLRGCHRLGRAAGRRERAHQQQGCSFPQGGGRGSLDGVDDHTWVTGDQARLQEVVHQLHPQLLESDRGNLQLGHGEKLRECLAPPQRQRRAGVGRRKPPGGVHVQLVRREP